MGGARSGTPEPSGTPERRHSRGRQLEPAEARLPRPAKMLMMNTYLLFEMKDDELMREFKKWLTILFDEFIDRSVSNTA